MKALLSGLLCALACLAVGPTRAHAQAVANPTTLVFTASADHARTLPVSGDPVVTGYRARYWLASQCTPTCPTTGTPAFTIPLGKPTPNAQNEIVVTNIFQGLVLNTVYRAVVEAVGPGGATASSATNPFGNETATPPGAPGTGVVSRQ